jgi:hypothetical protein
MNKKMVSRDPSAPFIYRGKQTARIDRKREAHRAECKQNDLPVVGILERRKFAYVFVDSLTSKAPLSQKQIDRIELMFGEFGEDGSRLDLSPGRCACQRVLLEHALPLANEVWTVATRH